MTARKRPKAAASKSLLRSRTFWFNAALLACTLLIDVDGALAQAGVSEAWLLRLATVGNIGLRCLSTARVTLGAVER